MLQNLLNPHPSIDGAELHMTMIPISSSLSTFVLVSWLMSYSAGEIITLDLEPTATLLQQHIFLKNHHGHGRRLDEDLSLQDDTHLGLLMHPFNSAVYSSLVEMDDSIHSHSLLKNVADEHNRRLDDFNSLRPFSRHERYLRERNPQFTITTEEKEVMIENEQHQTRNLRIMQTEEVLPPIFQAEDPEARDGGLYREFQSAPLSQGYGTHYATLWGTLLHWYLLCLFSADGRNETLTILNFSDYIQIP